MIKNIKHEFGEQKYRLRRSRVLNHFKKNEKNAFRSFPFSKKKGSGNNTYITKTSDDDDVEIKCSTSKDDETEKNHGLSISITVIMTIFSLFSLYAGQQVYY